MSDVRNDDRKLSTRDIAAAADERVRSAEDRHRDEHGAATEYRRPLLRSWRRLSLAAGGEASRRDAGGQGHGEHHPPDRGG